MFHIVLVHPEIPPNTGNVIRLCANTGWQLHLVEPLAFSMEDKQLRRAGLDYHETARVKRHANWQAFLEAESITADQCFALTTKGTRSPYDVAFKPGGYLVFGSETKGLPETIRAQIPTHNWLRLPMKDGQRSLNLSNAVAIMGYEAWRQNGFG
jgi:tRNA (cytidine/uridine-2'-O-)-methyltransferase